MKAIAVILVALAVALPVSAHASRNSDLRAYNLTRLEEVKQLRKAGCVVEYKFWRGVIQLTKVGC